MLRSLVGSEMCIRDRLRTARLFRTTRFGATSLQWCFSRGSLQMNFTLPVGSTGEVHGPGSLDGHRLESVVEGDAVLWGNNDVQQRVLDSRVGGIQGVTQTSEGVVVQVGSGTYNFTFAY
eukprot:TRINITY_DN55839_c0_g1_i1.p1 TRINITY_DN55839_c0_g1~~TRINITY_DN55839_c0_g1_i1.p1  ORF type:complete len:136 (+),score=38.41 TRINITY_DN55839_c0_g1_i1:49-408(+)